MPPAAPAIACPCCTEVPHDSAGTRPWMMPPSHPPHGDGAPLPPGPPWAAVVLIPDPEGQCPDWACWKIRWALATRALYWAPPGSQPAHRSNWDAHTPATSLALPPRFRCRAWEMIADIWVARSRAGLPVT